MMYLCQDCWEEELERTFRAFHSIPAQPRAEVYICQVCGLSRNDNILPFMAVRYTEDMIEAMLIGGCAVPEGYRLVIEDVNEVDEVPASHDASITKVGSVWVYLTQNNKEVL